jgi:hypothetical protein
MFRKSIFIAIVTIVIGTFSVSSSAQHRSTPGQMGGGLLGVPYGGGTSSATGKTDLVFQSNGQLYGTAYAYNGSHFEVYTVSGDVLKTYKDSCKPAAPSNGVAGLVCSFGHFDRNGKIQYSGWTYIYANGFVYLRWMYQARSNFKYVDGDTGWVGFRPKS